MQGEGRERKEGREEQREEEWRGKEGGKKERKGEREEEKVPPLLNVYALFKLCLLKVLSLLGGSLETCCDYRGQNTRTMFILQEKQSG